MSLSPRPLVLLTVVNAALALAQPIGTIQHKDGKRPGEMKTENGLIISWGLGRSEVDAGADRVNIFDERLHAVTSLNVLRPVAGARGVSIYDVSARPGGLIAVAAVYTSKEGDRKIPPAASLLLFDFDGRVRSAYGLAPSHEIRKLTIDEQSNIWTLTDNFYETDPQSAAMVVEYSPDGKVLRELLPRSVLWSHGVPPKESAANGRVAMGYDSGVVWFWLPGSADLVTISTSDASVKMVQTGIPKRENYRVVSLDVSRERSGDVVGVFREDGENGQSEVSYYARSHSTKAWSRFVPGECEPGSRPIGLSKSGGMVYALNHPGETRLCLFRRQ